MRKLLVVLVLLAGCVPQSPAPFSEKVSSLESTDVCQKLDAGFYRCETSEVVCYVTEDFMDCHWKGE